MSHSQFWKSTVIFVLEDDAQNGPDHVDSHRSVMFAISAYSHGGVQHRFTNTTDVIATIVEILHLGSLSQFDFYGRPLRDAFGEQRGPHAVHRARAGAAARRAESGGEDIDAQRATARSERGGPRR